MKDAKYKMGDIDIKAANQLLYENFKLKAENEALRALLQELMKQWGKGNE